MFPTQPEASLPSLYKPETSACSFLACVVGMIDLRCEWPGCRRCLPCWCGMSYLAAGCPAPTPLSELLQSGAWSARPLPCSGDTREEDLPCDPLLLSQRAEVGVAPCREIQRGVRGARLWSQGAHGDCLRLTRASHAVVRGALSRLLGGGGSVRGPGGLWAVSGDIWAGVGSRTAWGGCVCHLRDSLSTSTGLLGLLQGAG